MKPLSGHASNGVDWDSVQAEYEWTISGKSGNVNGRWFRGGYGNPAANAVDRHLEHRADALAVVDQRGGTQREVTYRDLYGESATLARWWQSHGVGAGDRVYLAGRATVEGLIAWLALVRLGAVVVRDRRPLDSQAVERMRSTECQWAAILGDDRVLNAVVPGRRRGRLDDLSVLALTWNGNDKRVWAYRQALDQAEGMIDAKPVEANAVGVLMYGNRSYPYAYSSLGSLLSWHQTLTRIVEVGPSTRLGLMTDLGGLHDLMPLTLAVLTAGGCAVWLDELSDAADTLQRPDMTIATRARGQHIAGGSNRIWILGSETYGMPAVARPQVHGDMDSGVYLTRGDDPADWAGGPGHDQTQTGQFGDTAPTGSEVQVRVEWPELGDDEVSDAVRIITADGRSLLWIASSIPEEELLGRLQGSAGDRILVVPELPYQVEGAVAVEVLEAISSGAVRVNLEGLLNPDAVPDLVAHFTSESPVGG